MGTTWRVRHLAAVLAALTISCAGSPGSGEAPGGEFRFPADFLWGVAASAYQTEGDSPGNDYDRWLRNGHGQWRNGKADNSYELFDLDSELARAAGANSFRMGIEWARVEPARDVFDESEIAHYRAVLESIRQRGMKPFVTLHHFTNPLWVADQGRWLNPGIVREFADYAGRMASALGDLADEWITINEPVIYATGAYWAKTYPGGDLLDMTKANRALVNMIYAHAAAYDAIRAADTRDADGDGRACRVAFVHALSPHYPADPQSPDDVRAAARFDQYYNRQIFDALVYGRLDPWLEPEGGAGGSVASPGPHPELAGRVDYVGINYYSPRYIRSFPGLLHPLEALPCFSFVEPLCFSGGRPDVVRGDNGNEVHPEGLFELIEDYASYGLPLIVTENGIAATEGRKRSWFIVKHLEQVERALRQGYRVEGYLHWSLLDNFEWLDGYSMRFGLYTVDFETFERTPTEAVQAYREIIRAGGPTPEILARYTWP